MISDLALARRLELAEAQNLLGLAGEAEPVAGGWAFFAGPGSPLNHAVAMGLTAPVTTADVERLECFYRRHGTPAAVDLCPFAYPALEHFSGYRVTECNQVLVKPLAGELPAPEDARVRLSADAATWAETASRGFLEKDGALLPEELEVGYSIYRGAGARCYLGFSGDAPGAAGALALHQGLALLYADGTAPAARRQGLQLALIRARLNTALAAGCDLATASTLPGSTSQRNYERAGFRVVYTKITLVK